MEQDNTCDDTEYCEFQYLYEKTDSQQTVPEDKAGKSTRTAKDPPGRYSSAPAFLFKK